MDLRAWIVEERNAQRQRLDQQVLACIPQERWRERQGDTGSSLAWMLFHTAVHEDVAMSCVVGGRPALVEQFSGKLGTEGAPGGAGIGEGELLELIRVIDLDALVAYKAAVTDATLAWLQTTPLDSLDAMPEVNPHLRELARVPDDQYGWLYNLWDAKPVSFFVRWECIGHGDNHVGEAVALRNRMGLSPF